MIENVNAEKSPNIDQCVWTRSDKMEKTKIQQRDTSALNQCLIYEQSLTNPRKGTECLNWLATSMLNQKMVSSNGQRLLTGRGLS